MCTGVAVAVGSRRQPHLTPEPFRARVVASARTMDLGSLPTARAFAGRQRPLAHHGKVRQMRLVKPAFYTLALVTLGMLFVGTVHDHRWLVPCTVTLPLVLLGLYDTLQVQNAILRNFPLLGHLRYVAESISPEIQQYFIERHTDGTPISENHRNLIYARSFGDTPTHPFGTEHDLYARPYDGLLHSIYPAKLLEQVPRVVVGNDQCGKPYSASLLNVSAMSYGALGPTAVRALSAGAKRGGFYVNTGEGSVSEHHLAGRGDLVWQIGTGYFGCRDEEGRFDPDAFQEQAADGRVQMIEVKLSQGAKPGHGGVLPAVKNTREIARIRLVEAGTTVYSPPRHRAFDDAPGLLRFIARLRSLSGGKPVGFKLCVGKLAELRTLCEQMRELDIVPDFITVDGAEGGTGAAPLEFTDSVGLPLKRALPEVDEMLREHGLRGRTRLIASGKVLTAYDLLEMLSLGADMCNAARAFMLSLGCIQALRCDKNSCPSGVATVDRRFYRGLVPEEKQYRVESFHRKTLEAALQLAAAAGVRDPRDIQRKHFVQGSDAIG